jgi:hypothetical protein
VKKKFPFLGSLMAMGVTDGKKKEREKKGGGIKYLDMRADMVK